jgi:hypothetical protein
VKKQLQGAILASQRPRNFEVPLTAERLRMLSGGKGGGRRLNSGGSEASDASEARRVSLVAYCTRCAMFLNISWCLSTRLCFQFSSRGEDNATIRHGHVDLSHECRRRFCPNSISRGRSNDAGRPNRCRWLRTRYPVFGRHLPESD